MTYFLTIVAPDVLPDLSHVINGQIKITTLSENRAVDIPISEPMSKAQIDTLRERLFCDIFITSAKNRKKKLFLADMDSTIVASETLDELAGFAGVKDKVSAITARSMAGEIDFETSLRERVALLEGMQSSHMQTILDQTELNDGAEILLKTLKAQGVYTVLISGGFTFYTESIAAKIGFDAHHGNVLEIFNGQLSGKVVPPILGPDAKLSYLQQYVQKLGLTADDVLAVGDGANDRFMLERAALGVGYAPKPLLQEILLNQIHYTDLTSLLYAQGYNDQEIYDIE
ncbi:MAG: phosphoserine phosphatase SerB [Micavibrio sp.]|nr:phosphoserine phosphatase SerB [Micavibrio sp.]